MQEATTILITLVVYKLLLLAIGFWASRRTHDSADFFLAGRALPGWIAALSASASSSSAWTLLGVSGAAFAWGLPALWLLPATVGGFALNWFWVGPRLRRCALECDAVTLTDVLVSGLDARTRVLAARLAAAIILFSFTFYVASQFQAAGDAFAATFDLSMRTSILLGAGVIFIYTLLGGFWAVSLTDALQGILMALTAILLPIAALIAAGGPAGVVDGLRALGDADLLRVTPEAGPIAAAGFVLGTLGIGMGYPGQPHVVNRFMALPDEGALRRGRFIAMSWALVVYVGMLCLGLAGRVLYSEVDATEQVFFVATRGLFPPVLAGVMIAAVLSAIMSTADSQLLVAGSAAAHDWPQASAPRSLWVSRLAVAGVTLLAVTVTLYAPEAIFTRVLFAWHAVGSAFGPILLLRLAGRPPAPAATLLAMAVGFALTVALHWSPPGPGDVYERVLPFVVALAIAGVGGIRSRPPPA